MAIYRNFKLNERVQRYMYVSNLYTCNNVQYEVQSKCVCSGSSFQLHKVLFIMHAHGTTVTNLVIHSLCAMTLKMLNQQCMLAQARPPMINHLTSVKLRSTLCGDYSTVFGK